MEDSLLPSAEAFYGDEWRFQQDNARPHVSVQTRHWLQTAVPEVLEWPPNSADLSPIENIWPLLKKSVEKENAVNLVEFEQKIIKYWTELDLPLLSRLIDTVPQRLRACRDLRGAEVKLKFI